MDVMAKLEYLESEIVDLQARYYSPGLLHGVLLSAVCGLRGMGGCFEAGVVVVPAGAGLVAASPS